MADVLPSVALTVRQPWAWSILFLEKDIENRDWPTWRRGRIFLHAAKGMTRAEYEEAYDCARAAVVKNPVLRAGTFPSFERLDRGGLIGTVEIVDCVTTSPSPCFFGRYGFVLRDPRPIPFVPCKGALGFWPVPRDILEQVEGVSHG